MEINYSEFGLSLDTLTQEEIEAFKSGAKLKFVKLVHDRTKCGLKIAKDFMDFNNSNIGNISTEILNDAVIFDLPINYYLNNSEIENLHNALDTVKLFHYRTGYGLLESKSVIDHYVNNFKSKSNDFIKLNYYVESLTHNLNLPNGVKIACVYKISNVLYAITAISDIEKFNKSTEFDLLTNMNYTNKVVIFQYVNDSYWLECYDSKIYQVVLFNFINKG